MSPLVHVTPISRSSRALRRRRPLTYRFTAEAEPDPFHDGTPIDAAAVKPISIACSIPHRLAAPQRADPPIDQVRSPAR